MSEAPERHIVVEIKLRSDSIRDAINALDEMRFWLTEIENGEYGKQDKYHSLRAGYDSGWTITMRENTDVTHDSYDQALKEYLAEKRREAEASTDG